MMIAGTEHRRQGCSLQDGKQWGYYVESQNPTDYRYWSIPFTSHYITMATKTYYEPKEEAVPWLVGIDMQKFICGYGANFIGSSYVSCVGIGCQPQWGYYTAAVGAIYTDVTTPVSFSRCFFAASIDILLAASTTWPGTTQTVWNINASTANKLRFIWAKAPIELDGAVWFGIFIQTVGKFCKFVRICSSMHISYIIYNN